MEKYYKIKQGECISSLSFRYGFFPETLWEHPKNSELKKLRKELHQLVSGDKVYVPALTENKFPAASDQKHRFRLKGVPEQLNLCFLYSDGNPKANIPYEIVIDKIRREGKTDAKGEVMEWLPPSAKCATITLETGEEQTFDLGHIDPISEVSGVLQRLANLGYYEGEYFDDLNEEALDAIRYFQESEGLEANSELNDETRDKLQAVHNA
jgi:hypothetical protein